MKTKTIDLSQLNFINENNKRVIESDKFYNIKMKIRRAFNKKRRLFSDLFDLIFKPKYKKCNYYDNYFKEDTRKKGVKNNE